VSIVVVIIFVSSERAWFGGAALRKLHCSFRLAGITQASVSVRVEGGLIPSSVDHLRKAGWFGGAAGPSKKTLFITLYPNLV
jgi:hypothetical protein